MARAIENPALRSALDILTSVVLIVAAGVLTFRSVFGVSPESRSQLQVPSEPVSIENATVLGSDQTEAVMIVYSDFQCPFCQRFAREVLPEIERRYIATGQVSLVFRHLPLPMHPQAVQAAVSAECAGRQGQFWEMHDWLFAQTSLDEEVLRALPESLEIERNRFNECLQDEVVSRAVQASADEASALGIRGTPAFFFGKRLPDGRVRALHALSGARPIGDFARELDATLSGEHTGWWLWLRSLVGNS